jgi:hypothetical protein
MFSLFVPNLKFEQSDALKVPEHLGGRCLLARTFTFFYVRPKRREQQSGTVPPLEVRAWVYGISPTTTPKPIFPFLEIELLFAALFPFFCDTVYVLSRARH